MAWKPGVSGNPGGRPRKSAEQIKFEEACRGFMFEKGFEILKTMAEGGKPADKRWALEMMLDRGLGKPAQSMALDVHSEDDGIRGISAAELEAQISELLSMRPAAAPEAH